MDLKKNLNKDPSMKRLKKLLRILKVRVKKRGLYIHARCFVLTASLTIRWEVIFLVVVIAIIEGIKPGAMEELWSIISPLADTS
jgi:hypothetical protein